MIIDDHVHMGLEVGGPKMQRKMWVNRAPDEHRFGCTAMRDYYVEKGRWDKKYLDPATIPPYTIEDLIYHMDDAGVDMCVLMGRDYQGMQPPYARVVTTADYVSSIVDKYPDRFVGLAPMNPWEANVHTRIKYYVEDLNMLGVAELYMPTGIDPADRKLMYPIYETCVEYDITCFVDCKTGAVSFGGRVIKAGNWPYANPRRLVEVGLDFPDLKLVQHLYGMCDGPIGPMVKRFPNFRTHAIYSSHHYRDEAAAKEWIIWFQENIPDQVFVGSDHLWGFPVKGIVDWVKSVPGLTDEFKTKALGENARKFYKI